jgi:hypothetical protein
MNNESHPGAASASSPRDNPCYGTDPTVATLNVFSDDGCSYQVGYAHFQHSEMTPNPALERNADEPPEQLLICFAAARVTVIGSGLKSRERAIQRLELKFVKSPDRRYVAALKTHVASVVVTFTQDKQ